MVHADSVVGLWATASRQKTQVSTPSRVEPMVVAHSFMYRGWANPLFNEVIVPMAEKDGWNAMSPHADNDFAKYVFKPELAGLLPALHSGSVVGLVGQSCPDQACQSLG